MRVILHSFLLLIIFSCCSCEKEYAFSQTHTLPVAGWSYDNILKYNFEVDDKEALYDLYLKVDYLTSFSYQNVYVNVYTGQDTASLKSTQLSLDVSDKLGIWKGDCEEERCSYMLPLQKSIFFEQAGSQVFWLEQFSRTDNLKGIQRISLIGDEIGIKS